MLLLETAFIAALNVAGDGSEAVAGARVYPVQSEERPSDVQLQSAVAQALQASPLTANSQIVVHVNQGEVTLEGAAMSPLAKREATRLAETVLGVRDIRNRLSVVDTKTADLPQDQ